MPVAIASHRYFSSIFAYFLQRDQRPWQRVLLECNAIVGTHTADYFRQSDGCIKLIRCQDHVVATIEVANNLQACSSVLLVVQTAGEHDNSHAENEIWSIRKIKIIDLGFNRRKFNGGYTQTKRCLLTRLDR